MKKAHLLLVLCAVFGINSAAAHELTWTNLMMAATKMQPHFDYEANVDSYMQLYRSDVWKRYRNDEFELQDKRDETIKIMKERISSFPLNEEFVINTTFEFGDYDFKNQVFPLNAIDETSYFYDREYSNGSFPRTYKVFFSNPTKIGDIRMTKEDAKAFLNSRKSSGGHIDRTINAKLQLRITGLKNNSDELIADLTHATIYRDRDGNKVLQKY